jgi:electron transfer flavoprotein beta subunit
MRVIVCTKAVPGGIRSVELDETTGTVRCEYHQLYMNESDEYALEEALALKRQLGADITVLSLGNLKCQDILYRSLAKGADTATRIDAEIGDPQIAAEIIAEALRAMTYDLVLTGVEATDSLAAQVGVSVAERLGLPSVFAVTRVEAHPKQRSIRVVKELGGGLQETLEVDLPALLCVQSGIQPLTYAALRKVIRARKQPIRCLRLEELGLSWQGLQARRLKIMKVFDPPKAEYAEIIPGSPAEAAGVLLEKIKNVLG